MLTIELPGLDRADLREALERMGAPLDAFEDLEHIGDRLHPLTEDDPLVVGLRLKKIQKTRREQETLTLDDLANQRSGLGGFIEDWWAEDFPLDDRMGLDLAEIFAASKGPLRYADLRLLLPSLRSSQLDKLLRQFERFLITDLEHRGHDCQHPGIGDYFWDKTTNTEKRTLEERFANWGLDTLERLEDGTLGDRVPPYLLEHLGGHLKRPGANSENLGRLVCNEWRKACLADERIGYGGFLSDVRLAFEAVPTLTSATPSEQALKLRCVLVFGSVNSLTRNVPPSLIAAAVRKGLWSLPFAIACPPIDRRRITF